MSASKQKRKFSDFQLGVKGISIDIRRPFARMVELVDTLDLKSSGQQCPCGFKSHFGYFKGDVRKIVSLFF